MKILSNYSIGTSSLDWQCDDCTIESDSGSLIVENCFSQPNDFQLSTEIDILESQNIRLTVEFEDYFAILAQVWTYKDIRVVKNVIFRSLR